MMETGTLTEMGVKPVDAEECWRCYGSGMTMGDGGDPILCPVCKGDMVAPAAPADEIEWGEWGPADRDNASDTYMLRKVNGVIEVCYPVKREPVVETVRLLTGKAYGWLAEPEGNCGDRNTHRITLTIIDDVVQSTATVEALK